MVLTESYLKRLQELAGLMFEANVEQLRTQYVDSGKMSEEDFRKILDVTTKGAYATWLTKKIFDKIITIEQLPDFKKYIELFDRRKNDFDFQDINQYKTSDDINKFISKYEELKDLEEKDPSQQKGVKKDDKYAEFKIGSIKGFDVYMIPKDRLDLYGASCELGSGTNWCTATGKTRDHFDNYIKKGPLFIFVKPGSDLKYQISYESNEVKDKENKNVEDLEIISFFYFIQEKFPEYNVGRIPESFLEKLLLHSLNDEKILNFVLKFIKENESDMKSKFFMFRKSDNLTDEQLTKIIQLFSKDLNIEINEEYFSRLSKEILEIYFENSLNAYRYITGDKWLKYVPDHLLNKINKHRIESILSNSKDLKKYIEEIGRDKIGKIINLNPAGAESIFKSLIDENFKDPSIKNILDKIDYLKYIFYGILNDSKMNELILNSDLNTEDIEKIENSLKLNFNFNFNKNSSPKSLARFIMLNDVDEKKLQDTGINELFKQLDENSKDDRQFLNDINKAMVSSYSKLNKLVTDEKYLKYLNYIKNFPNLNTIRFLEELILQNSSTRKKQKIALFVFRDLLKNIGYVNLYTLLYYIPGLVDDGFSDLLNFIYKRVNKKTLKQTFEVFGDSLRKKNIFLPEDINSLDESFNKSLLRKKIRKIIKEYY